ncbi:MAG: OmpH family outer membrane protein [Saprospiraceae bacterium]
MRIIMQSFLVLVLVACVSFTAEAQFGYTNSQAILLEMPKVKSADAKLEALQKQLQKKGQQMLESYQAKGADLQARYEKGELSQVKADAEMKTLEAEKQKIMKYEVDMGNQLASKREELIKPILEEVQAAIDKVAEEKGYQYIFDTGSGVLLYAKPDDDITPAVKAKLGM